jgi:membrane protein DedA with SNARE-associated domain
MFHLATSELTHFLTAYGYWAVLLFVAIESMGVPFPGETMLIVASVYAGTTHRLSPAGDRGGCQWRYSGR